MRFHFNIMPLLRSLLENHLVWILICNNERTATFSFSVLPKIMTSKYHAYSRPESNFWAIDPADLSHNNFCQRKNQIVRLYQLTCGSSRYIFGRVRQEKHSNVQIVQTKTVVNILQTKTFIRSKSDVVILFNVNHIHLLHEIIWFWWAPVISWSS